MTWHYGFVFKWKYVKRLAEKKNFYAVDNVPTTDSRVERYLRDITKTYFQICPDYRSRLILSFHQSESKGDLTGIRTRMAMMKVVGMILRCDEEEREPRWYTDDFDKAPRDDGLSSGDEELPIDIPFNTTPTPVRRELLKFLAEIDSSDEDEEASRSRRNKKRRTRINVMGKARIMSAGKARKLRA